jgi:hypothetical protein
VFREVCEHPTVNRPAAAATKQPATSVLHAVPELKVDHVRALTDDVGILQHARYTMPDREYGYSTNDNAGALIFALQAHRQTGAPELLEMAGVYLSFLQHAYDERNGRFRIAMSYDRRWREDDSSEDCHAWAL